jgi:superfamily I DNA/RNA helicase
LPARGHHARSRAVGEQRSLRTGPGRPHPRRSSIYQAKGREFDAVILAHSNKRSYPDTTDGRNLFYVALTRGRSRWHLITDEAQRSPLIDHL